MLMKMGNHKENQEENQKEMTQVSGRNTAHCIDNIDMQHGMKQDSNDIIIKIEGWNVIKHYRNAISCIDLSISRTMPPFMKCVILHSSMNIFMYYDFILYYTMKI